MTPGHTWLDCINKVLSILERVVTPVRDKQDKRGMLGLIGLLDLA